MSKMKRLVSCLLIITMLTTLLPAFSIANAEGAASNSKLYTYEDYKVEYTAKNSWGNR